MPSFVACWAATLEGIAESTRIDATAAAKTWLRNSIETSDVDGNYIPAGSRCQQRELTKRNPVKQSETPRLISECGRYVVFSLLDSEAVRGAMQRLHFALTTEAAPPAKRSSFQPYNQGVATDEPQCESNLAGSFASCFASSDGLWPAVSGVRVGYRHRPGRGHRAKRLVRSQ